MGAPTFASQKLIPSKPNNATNRSIIGAARDLLKKGIFMPITVQKLTKDELKKRDIFSWPIWEKGVSQFDWSYDEIEECYFLEGKVIVRTKDGKEVNFGKGDFVTFPKGLECTWDIKEPVKKHYNFR